MSTRPRYPAITCLLLAGGPLMRQPCPGDGADHAPFPTGYGDWSEYAAQLLHTGWTVYPCPDCSAWAIWRPTEPQPQPPMLPRPDGEPWELPCPDPDCTVCDDLEGDGWDDDPAEVDVVRGRPVITLHPLPTYL